MCGGNSRPTISRSAGHACCCCCKRYPCMCTSTSTTARMSPSPTSLDVWNTLTAKIPLIVSNGRDGGSSRGSKSKRALPTADALDIGPAQTLPAEATVTTTTTTTTTITETSGPKRKRQATGETMSAAAAASGSHLRGANLAILQVDDKSLMRMAIKKMPVAEVPELLEELQRGLYRSGAHLDKYLRCLSILLEEKFTFLSVTKLGQYQALKQLLSARTSLLDGCLRLKGRLDLLLSQTTKPEQRNTRPAAETTYESDSEEESEDDEEDEDENDDDDLRIKGDDNGDALDLDDEAMDEEMFGSDEEGDEEEEEEDMIEGDDAAAEGDDDSAAEADDDDDDGEEDDLEDDDDDD